MQLNKQQIAQFQQKILSWYAIHKRDLPWRKTRDPYKILVSEIMLQQTQVHRVIPKYEEWLQVFPSIEVLAKGKNEDILRLWSGLGYNRRALYLQKCAIAVRSRLDANNYWPKTIEGLEELPGIGPYTARAVACFAFNQQVAVVDTNVKKVILIQLVYPDTSVAKKPIISDKEITAIANQILPIDKAYEWNQALMDYSSMVLHKEKVPIKKQTAFKNSNRYYRGKLIRLLLEQKEIEKEQVGLLLRDDYSPKDELWKNTLLTQMVKDGLIREEKEKIRL